MDTQNSLRDGLLTVVLPAYNEQDSVPLAADTICPLLEKEGIRHEILPGRNLEGNPGPDCPASSGAGSLFFPQLW